MDKSPADVLEEAADLLLVHGRSQADGRDSKGAFCALGAIAEAVEAGWWRHSLTGHYFGVVSQPVPATAVRALASVLPDPDMPWMAETAARYNAAVYGWNDSTDDDFEVIDTLRHVAKDLRGQAVPT